MEFKSFMESATKEDFFRLANLQRNKPEKAMLSVQWSTGGSIMNSAVEHIGDLIHRMTEEPTFSTAGYEYVKEKVKKTLRWLTNGYGFEREFEENIKTNAPYLKTTEEELRNKVYKKLEDYADAHQKLPVYNEAQRLAQLAAVSLGRRQFKITVNCLLKLDQHLNSVEDWVSFAHQGLINEI